MNSVPANKSPLLKGWIFLSSIVLIAGILRVSFVFHYRSTPFFENILLDEQSFDTQSMEIIGGNLPQSATSNPLYPYFLAGIYLISEHDLLYPRLANAFIDMLSCLLVYHVSRRYFESMTSHVAAFLYAIYLPIIYTTAHLQATSLVIFLLLSSILFFEKMKERNGRRFAFSGGLSFGLALAARPNFIIILPCLLMWLFGKKSLSSLKHDCTVLIFLILGLAAAIGPFTILNRLGSGEWVLVSAHGGLNFYIGNHANATGWYVSLPGIADSTGNQVEDSIHIASQETGRILSAKEASKYWFSKSLAFFQHQPFEFVKLQLRKILIFWNGEEIALEESLFFQRQFSAFLRSPLPNFFLISPLALLGLTFGWNNRRKASLLYIFALAGMLSVSSFFVASRYRMPVAAFLLIFSSEAIVQLVAIVRNRLQKKLIFSLIVLIIFTIIANYPIYPRHYEAGYYNLAKIYFRTGNFQQAEFYCRLILKSSETPKVHNFLGQVLLGQGKTSEALQEFDRALALDSKNFDALTNAGFILFSKGNSQGATSYYKQAIGSDPRRYEPYFNLGLISFSRGETEVAREYMEQAFERNPPTAIINQINEALSSMASKDAASTTPDHEIQPAEPGK